jgi:hypothetical protein
MKDVQVGLVRIDFAAGLTELVSSNQENIILPGNKRN